MTTVYISVAIAVELPDVNRQSAVLSRVTHEISRLAEAEGVELVEIKCSSGLWPELGDRIDDILTLQGITSLDLLEDCNPRRLGGFGLTRDDVQKIANFLDGHGRRMRPNGVG